VREVGRDGRPRLPAVREDALPHFDRDHGRDDEGDQGLRRSARQGDGDARGIDDSFTVSSRAGDSSPALCFFSPMSRLSGGARAARVTILAPSSRRRENRRAPCAQVSTFDRRAASLRSLATQLPREGRPSKPALHPLAVHPSPSRRS